MKRFEISSTVSASPSEAWRWITSIEGISAELAPYLRMSVPRGITALPDLKIEAGVPLFRSTIYLFGVLPVDYSKLTLLSLDEGVGFIEQSPMGSMRLWRHERTIQALTSGCRIADSLSFEPRFMPGLAAWVVKQLFTHRHKVLRVHFQNIQ
jgi:ligand-binding SRPBCC domain-containing protein